VLECERIQAVPRTRLRVASRVATRTIQVKWNTLD
jgi:hypothetical protein